MNETTLKPFVYTAAARDFKKATPNLNETAYKSDLKIFTLEADGYNFWSNCKINLYSEHKYKSRIVQSILHTF